MDPNRLGCAKELYDDNHPGSMPGFFASGEHVDAVRARLPGGAMKAGRTANASVVVRWTAALGVALGFACGSLAHGEEASQRSAVPDYLDSEHKVVIKNWIGRNPQFRVAVDGDCCDNPEVRSDTVATHRQHAENPDLYYVSADLNRDGSQDFAVVLIDQRAAALSVFNGPFGGSQEPTYLQEEVGAPSGSILWLRKGGLSIGPAESDKAHVIPTREGYLLSGDTITVAGKKVTLWPMPQSTTHEYSFDSKGYRNTYALDCEGKRFQWFQNIRISTGQITGNARGAEWRPLNPKSTISTAVYEVVCPKDGVVVASDSAGSYTVPKIGSIKLEADTTVLPSAGTSGGVDVNTVEGEVVAVHHPRAGGVVRIRSQGKKYSFHLDAIGQDVRYEWEKILRELKKGDRIVVEYKGQLLEAPGELQGGAVFARRVPTSSASGEGDVAASEATEVSQGGAAQADRISVKDGSTLTGKIKGGKVPFKSSFGEIGIRLKDVQSYEDGKLRLADGTLLKGVFEDEEIEIETSVGNLEVDASEIVGIKREGIQLPGTGRPAAGQGVLVGKVIDNFGQPAPGVTVRIAGTNLATQAATDGTYQLPYVPGDFVVHIEGSGYDPTTFALKLAQASTYPVEDKTLLRLPPRMGVFFWDKDGWSPLGECTLQQTSVIPNDGNIDFRGVRKDAYRVTGSPYRVISNQKPVFFAHTPALKSLLVYRIDRRGEIVTRTFGGGLGGFAAMLSDSGSSKGTSIAKAWKTQPYPNRSFFFTENQPGVYAVVDRSYKNACFTFQIGNTQQQVRRIESEAPSKASTISVGKKTIKYWPSKSKKSYALFYFNSKGYRNTYTLDCENKQFLWTENLQVSTGNVTGRSRGSEWRPMNPASTIANAVYEKICASVLSGAHGASEGKASMAGAGTLVADASSEQALNLSRARRRQVQAWLVTLGYKPGPADGVFGKGTRQSIEAWQTATGLPPSGFLNAVQIERLGEEGASPEAQNIYWKAIRQTRNAAVLEEFVSLYPDGAYSALARDRIQVLRQAANKPSRSAGQGRKSSQRGGRASGSKRYGPKERRAIDAFNNL